MERRIFVINPEEDASELAALRLWVQSHNGTLTSEPIMAGTLETVFTRMTLEYPTNTPLEGFPGFPEYTPFSIAITGDTSGTDVYTDKREHLDCAILSNYTDLPVTMTKKTLTEAGLEVAFYIDGSVPLWIDPRLWDTYIQLISVSPGMELIAEGPLFSLVLEIAKYQGEDMKTIFKHPSLNVWYGPFPTYMGKYASAIDGVFAFLLDPEGTSDRFSVDELIHAFEYKKFEYISKVAVTDTIGTCTCSSPAQPVGPTSPLGISPLMSLDGTPSTVTSEPVCRCGADEVKLVDKAVPLTPSSDYYYLQEEPPFTEEWFHEALFAVRDCNIPFVTVQLAESKAHPAAVRHNLIQALLATLEERGSTYLTPYYLEAATVDDSYTATLAVDSKATLRAVLSKMGPDYAYHALPVQSVDEGLVYRYLLSKQGVASLLLDNVVTWEGKDALKPLTNEEVKALTGTLRQDLLNYLMAASREAEDVISGSAFKDLLPSELVEVLVTRQRNAYELRTITSMTKMEDPLTRQLFTPSDLTRLAYGATGFFTVGPLKGLRDHVMVPQPIYPLDGYVQAEVGDYYDPNELIAAVEEGRVAVPAALKQVEYNVSFMDSSSQTLVTLLLLPQEVLPVQELLVSTWNAGDFLSSWSRAYIKNQGAMSHSFFIPAQLKQAEESRSATESAVAYLTMLSGYRK
ncbi:Hypothetical protein POVN_LOCUS368 [uncultured virus]|nr:Hypothetical protein POVN_LOCUS368 [uncultured virus]